MPKMDDQTLRSLLSAQIAAAGGDNSSSLATDRASALSHYRGEPLGSEVEGRSRVVSRDVAEAIDQSMPASQRGRWRADHGAGLPSPSARFLSPRLRQPRLYPVV